MAGTQGPRLRRRVVAFPMVEFVRPDCYWPQPFSLDQAFAVMAAAMRAGADADIHDEIQWRGRKKLKLIDHLIGGGGFGFSPALPITSLDGLRGAFHRLVLGRAGPAITAWRREAQLDHDGVFKASFPHYKPFDGTPFQGNPRASEHDVQAGAQWLFEGSRGKALAVSLNTCHLEARTVGDVTIEITASGLRMKLAYTLDGSSWSHPLACGTSDEPMSTVLDRAVTRMKLLLGEGHPDRASLCKALNRAEAADPHGNPDNGFWIAGERPIRGGRYGEAVERFMVSGKIGYGEGAITLSEVPTGEVILRDPSYGWDRMTALSRALNSRFPSGTPLPTSEDIAEIEAVAA